ncbi:prolipoprotein diacylglyceryl transferase [Nocardioides sp. zg-536]|uniref:Phosphatidylglycerol--prolipoprotein diacylglyceryl transferase n=1 Tax=Nocardioides faecalis TaxID=2803858 RepID=A0A938Y7A3_9ACTN|nr:prolipoprotein diacylglyceryl transferase [Nocardioides faecalis]MBM9460522.1 prolipoprotein diacylglyceryl transferase [Nocardioides faecalis]QVI57545.1 prolipoprotein diacylglyceryl transferase [Nocardioides faecalis]
MLPVLPQLIAATIPSPDTGVWHLGPFPLRGYALCIIAGIVAAIWIGERRWQSRGGTFGDVQDIAVWAVPFGIVGARLYHVATDWRGYFGEGGDPVSVLYIWQGGLGVWGGIALGAVGAWIGARRKGIRVAPLLDALAPGVLVGQAIGRWGNWFNQELYGRPTDLPWALEIDRQHYTGAYEQQLYDNNQQLTDVATFHPTFLYECLWNLAAFALIIWLDRRFRLGHGRVVAVYVMAYTLGRGWIEYLRIDDVQLDDVWGLRFNVWTSIVLFVLAAAYFVWSARRAPGRETEVYVEGRGPVAEETGVEETGAEETGAEETVGDDTVADGAVGRASERRDGDPADSGTAESEDS